MHLLPIINILATLHEKEKIKNIFKIKNKKLGQFLTIAQSISSTTIMIRNILDNVMASKLSMKWRLVMLGTKGQGPTTKWIQ